jgi:hypothetical protein
MESWEEEEEEVDGSDADAVGYRQGTFQWW